MRLVTWNIQSCTGCDGVLSPRRIVEDARALADFDVLCVQEVASNFAGLKSSAGEDQFAQLAELLPGFIALPGIAVDHPASDGGRRRFGNAIFSRLPVRQVVVTRLPRPADPHATRSMDRCLLEAVIATPLGPVRVMTTHLEFFSPLQRQSQVNALLARHAEAALRGEEGPGPDGTAGPFQRWPEPADAVLAGDFNFEADDPLYADLTASHHPRVPAFADAWVHMHPGEVCPPTAGVHDRAQWQRPMACDFIFTTPGLLPHVRKVEVDGRTTASDHQPMLLELGHP